MASCFQKSSQPSKAPSIKPTPAPNRATASAPQSSPTPAPKPSPSATPVDLAASWLKSATERFEKLQSYQAKVTIFNKKDAKSHTNYLDYIFSKPYKSLLKIYNSTDPAAIGIRIRYDGGSTLTVRATGLLGLVPVGMSTDDDRVTGLRQYDMAKINMRASLNRLDRPDTQLTLMGKSEQNGRSLIMMKAVASERMDGEITHEILGIDSETKILALQEMYVGEDLVFQIITSDVVLDPILAASAFDI